MQTVTFSLVRRHIFGPLTRVTTFFRAQPRLSISTSLVVIISGAGRPRAAISMLESPAYRSPTFKEQLFEQSTRMLRSLHDTTEHSSSVSCYNTRKVGEPDKLSDGCSHTTENLGTQPAVEVAAEAPLAGQDLAEDQTDTRGKRKRAGSPDPRPRR